MISRGVIIGKIIDDFAKLQFQIDLRNKLGLLDLTKVSEDFFKELINIVYDLNLINLNIGRVNEPGIDLGDLSKQIAFQVTSTKTTEKINNTLEKIQDSHLEYYKSIKVIIIGKKQKSYSINPNHLKRVNFDYLKDIIDLDDIIRDIVVLDIVKLEEIYSFFQRSFREVIIELEPMDAEGNFESSIYNYLEVVPNNPPKNVKRMDDYYKVDSNLNDYVEVYNKLAVIPKSLREYIALIGEKGFYNTAGLTNRHEILCVKLATILGMKEEALFKKMAYLEEENIVHFIDNRDYYDRPVSKYGINGEYLNYLILYLRETNASIRKTIVAMDFTVLED